MKPVIFIPARMASVRLPGKPLAEIAGLPMIIQVLRRAEEAALGWPIYVACAEEAILATVEQHGGRAVMTDAELPSGTDRIWQALQRVDPKGKVTHVVNIQGDLPTIQPEILRDIPKLIQQPGFEMGSFVYRDNNEEHAQNPNVVKATVEGDTLLRGEIKPALDFNRDVASVPFLHHLGLYVYTRERLKRFTELPPSTHEVARRLEQMRVMDDGGRIDLMLADSLPMGVDTPEDLEHVREIFAKRKESYQ